MTVNAHLLHSILPRAPASWIDVLVDEPLRWGIDTNNELASFIAQLAHESSEFTHLEENLSYSSERLMQVWPRRFPTIGVAQRYEHNPVQLANHVYANRIGNGDEESGDGWRFHGRGPIQITGRRNYTDCGAVLGVDLIGNPGLLITPVIGIQSALWFWRSNNLDDLDDDLDVRLEFRRINGGETGLAHRQAYFDRCLQLLEAA